MWIGPHCNITTIKWTKFPSKKLSPVHPSQALSWRATILYIQLKCLCILWEKAQNITLTSKAWKAQPSRQPVCQKSPNKWVWWVLKKKKRLVVHRNVRLKFKLWKVSEGSLLHRFFESRYEITSIIHKILYIQILENMYGRHNLFKVFS